MTVQQSLTILAGFMLVLQLVSLRPTFSLPHNVYGITVERSEFILPLRVNQATPATFSRAYSATPSTILFTGDLLLARNVEFLMEAEDRNYPFAGLAFSDFSATSYVVGNFESAIPFQHVPTKTGQLRFSVKSGHVAALKQAGFTHLSLANNHAFDFGIEGYLNAGETFLHNGLEPFGDPRGLTKNSITLLKTETESVALIALQALQNPPTEAEIEATLVYATKISDLQILYVHWGDEYVLTSNKAQRKLAETFIAHGVDLIVGHHPHVVQDIERIDGVLVFYSLGNYVFDQYDSTETQEGLVLQLELSELPMIHLIPVSSAGTLSQPALMTQGQSALFLKRLTNRSDLELSLAITAGQLPLRSLVATSSKIAMINK
jgi:poly-gamma-glutamate synthesis protein (capsule biosynthesis protein)